MLYFYRLTGWKTRINRFKLSRLTSVAQNKEQLIKTEIEKSTIGEKATMYEMVDMLLNVISKRIQL